MLAEEGVQPSQFKGRIIFMSMYNDFNWWQNQNEEVCKRNAIRVRTFAKTSNHVDSLSSVTTLVWDLGSENDGEVKLFSGNYDARIRYEWTCCVQVLNATAKTHARNCY